MWPLALLSQTCRRIIPGLMLGCHLMIFLSSGISFLIVAVASFSIVVPWRHILRTRTVWKQELLDSPSNWSEMGATMETRETWLNPVSGLIQRKLSDISWAMSGSGSVRFRVTAMLAAVTFLVLYPAWSGSCYYPFPNYCQFGWSYAPFARPTEVYRLGYVDPETGRAAPLPMYYSGFFDYALVPAPGINVEKYFKATKESERQTQLLWLQQYARAVRPYQSDCWLLGPLSCPTRIVCKSKPVPAHLLRQLHLVRAEFDYERTHSVEVVWQDLGPLPPEPEWDQNLQYLTRSPRPSP
jgi:hypothetical protein